MARSRFIIVDWETQSRVNLREQGGHVYAADPSTRIVTTAWLVDGAYHAWLYTSRPLPADVAAVHLPGVTVHYGPSLPSIPTDRPWVAHNAYGFDALVWRGPQPTRWIDSACIAASAGLPSKLETVAQQILGEGKWIEGAEQMKKHCREVKEIPPVVLAAIAKYNVQDVRVTAGLMDHLEATHQLPRSEIAVLATHREVNDRGVRVDLTLVDSLVGLLDEAVTAAVERCAVLSDGKLGSLKTLRSAATVVKWIESLDVAWHSGMAKADVAQWIDSNDARYAVNEAYPESSYGRVAALLTARQAALRVTAGKLSAARARTSADSVMRGVAAYYGAHPGRWAGRGMQLQNLPTPKPGVPIWELLALPKLNAANVLPLLSKGATLDDAASSLIRTLFVPHVGDECLLAGDYAAIEVRVLAALAGQEWLEQSFRDRDDPYLTFGEKLTGRRASKKDPVRKLYKVIVLAGGYQQGPIGLLNFCNMYGLDLAEYGYTPQAAVHAYRDTHPAIAGQYVGDADDGRHRYHGGFWREMEAGAIAVATGRRERVQVGRWLYWHATGGVLKLRLPSGRDLCYRGAAVRTEKDPWDRDCEKLYYRHPRYGTISTYGGKLTENAVQAVASDILRDGLLRCRAAGLRTVLHVHDEVVCSGAMRDLPLFMATLSTPPDWWQGTFTLEVEGGALPRYAKSPPPGDQWREQSWVNGVDTAAAAA